MLLSWRDRCPGILFSPRYQHRPTERSPTELASAEMCVSSNGSIGPAKKSDRSEIHRLSQVERLLSRLTDASWHLTVPRMGTRIFGSWSSPVANGFALPPILQAKLILCGHATATLFSLPQVERCESSFTRNPSLLRRTRPATKPRNS